MKGKKCILALTLVSAVMLGGCGGDSYSSMGSNAKGYDAPAYEEAAASAAYDTADYEDGFSSYAGGSYERMADEMPEEMNEESTAAESAPSTEEGKLVASNSDVLLDSEKIVYYADIAMSSIHFDEALKQIREAGEKYGALIQSENFTEGDNSWYIYGTGTRRGRTYYVEYRVPAKNYRDLLDSTGDMDAVVDSRNTSAQNITQQYSDLKAEIASLEAEKKQLEEIMKEAVKVSDVLEIQERITQIQTELNQDNSNIRRMDTDVSYSYVNINLKEVSVYEEKEDPPEATFSERITKNFAASIQELKEFFKGLVLFLVRNWIHLIVLAIIIIVAVALIKRGNKKSAEKREKMRIEREKRMAEGNMPMQAPTNMKGMPPAAPPAANPGGMNSTVSPVTNAEGMKPVVPDDIPKNENGGSNTKNGK